MRKIRKTLKKINNKSKYLSKKYSKKNRKTKNNRKVKKSSRKVRKNKKIRKNKKYKMNGSGVGSSCENCSQEDDIKMHRSRDSESNKPPVPKEYIKTTKDIQSDRSKERELRALREKRESSSNDSSNSPLGATTPYEIENIADIDAWQLGLGRFQKEKPSNKNVKLPTNSVPKQNTPPNHHYSNNSHLQGNSGYNNPLNVNKSEEELFHFEDR